MDIILKRLFSFIVVFFVGVSMFAGGTIKNVKKKAVDTQMTDEPLLCYIIYTKYRAKEQCLANTMVCGWRKEKR